MLVSSSYAPKGLEVPYYSSSKETALLPDSPMLFPEEEKKFEYEPETIKSSLPSTDICLSPSFGSKTPFKLHKVNARKVYSNKENIVPSMDLGSKDFDQAMKEAIRNHASMRVQLFALTGGALDKVAVASDPLKSRCVQVGIGHAYLQFGKGSKKFHAAHSNAAAGYGDNWREVTIERVSAEKGITPKTLRILRCKGFSDEEFEKLKINAYTLEAVSDCFDKCWPKENGRPDSLLSGTNLEKVLNSTVTLPRAVNLFVDKAIEEDLRPKIEKLYEDIMHGKLEVEEGCHLYRAAIKERLNNLDAKINEKLKCLDQYREVIKTFFSETSSIEERKKNANSLIEIYKEIRECKGFEVFKFVNMPQNKEFISKLDRKKALGAEDFQKYFNEIKSQKTRLLKETDIYQKTLLQNQEYCGLEKSGTIVPPFKHLFGTSDRKKLQSELLTRTEPLTPLKKKRCVVASKVGGEE